MVRIHPSWSSLLVALVASLLALATACAAPDPAGARIASARTTPLARTSARELVVIPKAGVRRWPGRTIAYWDSSREPIAVARAVAAWNRSGVGIRFVRARSARAARLIIRNTRDVPNGCGSGQATVGYVDPPGKAYVNILSDPAPKKQACAWPGQTLLVAHELGHVLGLGHVERGCRLMNTSFVEGIAPDGCITGTDESDYIDRIGTWRCRIIEAGDAVAAIRRYGGTLRPVRVEPTCNVVAPVAAPALAATWDPVAQRVQLAVRRPVSPFIPPFLQSRADRTERFEVYRGAGSTCVTTHRTPEAPFAEGLLPGGTWSVAAGGDEVVVDAGTTPGTWCYSAWAVDAFGKYGDGPATTSVLVPDAPPPA